MRKPSLRCFGPPGPKKDKARWDFSLRACVDSLPVPAAKDLIFPAIGGTLPIAASLAKRVGCREACALPGEFQACGDAVDEHHSAGVNVRRRIGLKDELFRRPRPSRPAT